MTTYTNHRHCSFCQQVTAHECFDSGHERDGSHDWQRCLVCSCREQMGLCALTRRPTELMQSVEYVTGWAESLSMALAPARTFQHLPIDTIEMMRARGWTEQELEAVDRHLSSLDFDKDFDYADNDRFARRSNPEEVAEYERIAAKGCCGSYDEELPGGLMVGFNYGH